MHRRLPAVPAVLGCRRHGFETSFRRRDAARFDSLLVAGRETGCVDRQIDF
jgi:hypothetical protein